MSSIKLHEIFDEPCEDLSHIFIVFGHTIKYNVCSKYKIPGVFDDPVILNLHLL